MLAAHPTLENLAAALDGSGPPLLTTTEPRVLAAVRPDDPLEHDDVVVVVPTSGSTGEPKGVLLTADNLRASADATASRLGGHGQWLLAIPPTHVGGLQVLVRSLLAGTTPEVVFPFDTGAFARATERLTGERRYVSLVPTQLRRLLASEHAESLRAYDAVLLGGAAAPEALGDAARVAGARVRTTYGMSETSGGCVYDGVPLDGVQVELVDGRVRLRGRVVARGYRLRSEDAFVGDAFTTSDLGRLLPDGRLQVLGRADDVVVTGGEKVPPAAVESALEAHPSVVEAAVVGVPDDEWGERVVAYVVLRGALSLERARDQVSTSLPRAFAPRELRVVEALPLLASGKVDRADLRSRSS